MLKGGKMSRKKTHEEYVEELRIKNPTVEVIGEYVNGKTKITHHCLIHDVYWDAMPANILKGQGCKKCMKEKISSHLSKSHQQYVADLAIANPFVEVVDDYNGSSTSILHHCLLHNVYWKMSPHNALMGNGCVECRKEKHQKAFAKTHEEYISDVALVNPDIEVIGEYINAKTPILHRCKIDGREWIAAPTNILSGQGCPQCKESSGERHVRLWLDKNNISYVREKIFEDCHDKQSLPFDFYLTDYNIAIEYQGQQHYRSIDIFGGERAFKLQQNHDKIKSDYCEVNNIRLICIPYYENVEEKLNNILFI